MENFKHLSFASSLCGACTSVCPVKIDLHNLLLLNRKQSVKEGLANKWEVRGFKLFTMAMKNRSWLNFGGSSLKNLALSFLFKNSWDKHREMPELAPKNFNELWKEKRGKK